MINEDSGEVVACHGSKDSARRQLAALYANVPDAERRAAGMGDVHYRDFMPDLEVRARGDGRTIVGIAVPYDRPQYIDRELIEQFARGAFNDQIRAAVGKVPGVGMPANRVPFARDHLPLGGELIGATKLLRDDAAGLYGEWRVSATPAGDATLELVKDGALWQLSIGFREGTNRRLPDGVTERVTAELREVAVVLEGAYHDAAVVSAVRAAGLPYAGDNPAPMVTPQLDSSRAILESVRVPRV